MSGMAEVLAAHPDWLFSIERQEVVCAGKSCDWAEEVGPHQPSSGLFRNHQAAALSAAGFGPVKEAAAKALEDAADELARSTVRDPLGKATFENYAEWLRGRAAAISPEGAKE